MDKTARTHLKRDLAHDLAWRSHLATRFTAQADFARRLAAFEGDAAAGWEDLIVRAERILAPALTGGSRKDLEDALAEAEAALSPIGAVAKQHTIHCVGHGHIDMNWMWGWPETVAVTNDTFLTVLKLMDEFPDLTYSQSQASVYEIARVYNPELFERIKERVKEGRWEISASHWVEGDRNLASGESLTRHLLYTRRFMKEHFGLEPEDILIDWSPDTFGHANTIPTIDVRGGVRHYYLCRPGATPRPAVFWWQGPDGSRVLVNRETVWYNSELAPQSVNALLEFREKTGLKDWMQVYGVGDHGGGPTRRDIRMAMDMDTWPIFPNFRFATTRDFFKILEAHGDRWPVLEEELNYEFAGCYVSQSFIKKANRFGENAACEAETAATLAYRALGRPYPGDKLRDAWVDVLFNHFHDILPGSGVADTRTYNQGQFQGVMAATGMVKTHALRALAANIDTSFGQGEEGPDIAPELEPIGQGAGAGRDSKFAAVSDLAHTVDGPRPIVIFNPTAWPRAEVVHVTVWDAQTGLNPGDLNEKTFVARDSQGNVIPAQRTGTGNYWGHKYMDLAFPAAVGPLGYAAYVIEEGVAPDHTPGVHAEIAMEGGWGVNLRGGSYVLENEYLRVGFDKTTAGIIEFVDKRTGKNLASATEPMALLEYVLERPQSGSSWIFGDTQRRDYPLEVEGFGHNIGPDWVIDAKANSPHVATAQARVLAGGSKVSIVFQLKAGQPWLDITVSTRWVEQGSPEIGIPQLSICFPSALTNVTPRYETPFGSVTRDVHPGREVPALRWADMAGTLGEGGDRAGLTLVNDSKYGHALDGGTMRLTLLRSTYDPDPLPEYGDHTFRMALAPHDGDATVADLVRLGAGFNHPLQPVQTEAHGGDLPAALENGLVCDAPNVIASQIKKAEDGDGVIFRLYETDGKETKVSVQLAAPLFGTPAEAVEVDFIERPTAKNTASTTADGFTVTVPAHGIASVRVR